MRGQCADRGESRRGGLQEERKSRREKEEGRGGKSMRRGQEAIVGRGGSRKRG